MKLLQTGAQAVQAMAYFVGVTFLRGKPWKCAGDDVRDIGGPILLCLTYAASWAWAWYRVRALNGEHRARYVRMEVVSGDQALVDGIEAAAAAAPPQGQEYHRYLLVLSSAVMLHARRKFPLFLFLVHLLVVSIAVPSESCAELNMGLVAAYGFVMLAAAFVYGAAIASVTRTGGSGAEKFAYALGEGFVMCLFLFSLILIRAKVVKCLPSAGLALAYATSVPLLYFTLILAVVSSYMLLRTYRTDELLQISELPSRKAQ